MSKTNNELEKKLNLGLTYNQFVERLVESQNSVEFIQKYIQKKGLLVEVPELKITPNVESKDNFSDSGDLIFYRKNGERVLMEIKQFSINFTDTDFRYEEIIVNSYTGYNSKKEKPDIHLILSKDRRYAAVIDNSFIKEWKLKKAYDKIKKKKLMFYFLKKDKVKFVKL